MLNTYNFLKHIEGCDPNIKILDQDLPILLFCEKFKGCELGVHELSVLSKLCDFTDFALFDCSCIDLFNMMLVNKIWLTNDKFNFLLNNMNEYYIVENDGYLGKIIEYSKYYRNIVIDVKLFSSIVFGLYSFKMFNYGIFSELLSASSKEMFNLLDYDLILNLLEYDLSGSCVLGEDKSCDVDIFKVLMENDWVLDLFKKEDLLVFLKKCSVVYIGNLCGDRDFIYSIFSGKKNFFNRLCKEDYEYIFSEIDIAIATSWNFSGNDKFVESIEKYFYAVENSDHDFMFKLFIKIISSVLNNPDSMLLIRGINDCLVVWFNRMNEQKHRFMTNDNMSYVKGCLGDYILDNLERVRLYTMLQNDLKENNLTSNLSKI